ncbi:DUF4328 domain-containing protein [Streptomyces sp. NPDC046977]|uniref:DUF4328 domain-containing protein n=1 Tax=Streptomyces sp. NPDC046977 TaxID=3154703 RepID=UPI003411CC25
MTAPPRKAPRPLARAAQTAIAAAAVADVFRALEFREHTVPDLVSQQDEAPHDPILGTQIFFWLMTLSAVLFLVWLARARRNALHLSPEAEVPTGGWVTGAWFVPLVNLFVPLQHVLAIGRASSPAWDRKRDTTLAGLWWAGWVGHGLALTAVAQISPGSMAGLVVSEVLMAAAAVLLILVIERITALQSAALYRPAPVPTLAEV